jgi:hypothetical protein
MSVNLVCRADRTTTDVARRVTENHIGA